MWEIIETTEKYAVWRRKDAEGRWIYAANDGKHEPISGLYSHNIAIAVYLDHLEIMASLED